MKKKLALIVICLLCVVTLLTGCNSIKLDGVPAVTDTVYGNGGHVVRQGNYIYFTKDYVDGTTLTKDDNKEGKVTQTALYRTKLNEGKVSKDDKGFVKDYELVVPKVVGHKNCGIFIFDSYLYYSTPNMDYTTEGTLQSTLGYLDICRVKLDGSENERLYSTENYNATTAFYRIMKIGTKVYIVLFDGSDIVKVEVDGKKVTKTTLVSGVSEVKMKNFENYVYAENNTMNQFEKCVYYTRALTEDDGYLSTEGKGNKIGRVDIVNGTKVELNNSEYATYSLLDVKDGYVFYKKNELVFANNFERATDSEIQITKTSDYSVVSVLDTVKEGDEFTIQGVVVTFEGKTFIVKGYDEKGDLVSKKISDAEVTPKLVYGSYIYYLEDTSLVRMDISSEEFETEVVLDDADYDSSYIVGECDKDNLYVFMTYTGDSESAKYLARVDFTNKIQPDEEDPEKDSDGEIVTDLGYEIEDICKIDEKHVKTEDEARDEALGN